MRLPACQLVLGDAPAPWEALGFDVVDGRTVLAGLELRFTGEGGGIRALTIDGLRADHPDGLPLTATPSVSHTDPYEAPRGTRMGGGGALGAVAVDHVVAFTGSLDRTVAALEGAGLELRRRRDPPEAPVAQAFFNLATTVLEVGETDDPSRFWGITVVVEDLDAAAARLGPLLGEPRPAVQPGRRIATLRRDAGLGLAMALMTPRVRTR